MLSISTKTCSLNRHGADFWTRLFGRGAASAHPAADEQPGDTGEADDAEAEAARPSAAAKSKPNA